MNAAACSVHICFFDLLKDVNFRVLYFFCVQEVTSQIWATLYDYPCLKKCQGLKTYIEKCVRVSWGLVNQVSKQINYESESIIALFSNFYSTLLKFKKKIFKLLVICLISYFNWKNETKTNLMKQSTTTTNLVKQCNKVYELQYVFYINIITGNILFCDICSAFTQFFSSSSASSTFNRCVIHNVIHTNIFEMPL